MAPAAVQQVQRRALRAFGGFDHGLVFGPFLSGLKRMR
jgi:hypothetical protein